MVRQRQGKVLRAVVPFIVNITEEINFSSKVYSKSLLKGSRMSCTSLEEVISSPQYGYRYLNKLDERDLHLLHSMDTNLFYFVVSIGIATFSIIVNVVLVVKAT